MEHSKEKVIDQTELAAEDLEKAAGGRDRANGWLHMIRAAETVGASSGGGGLRGSSGSW
jgi:hypothetical protein